MYGDTWAPRRPVYSMAFECLGPKLISYADLEVTHSASKLCDFPDTRCVV